MFFFAFRSQCDTQSENELPFISYVTYLAIQHNGTASIHRWRNEGGVGRGPGPINFFGRPPTFLYEIKQV